MGNAHDALKRDRSSSSCSSTCSGNHSLFSFDDQHPVQLKAPRIDQPPSLLPFGPLSEFPVGLKWSGQANQVFISGSWNNWSTKLPLVKSAGNFSTIVNVPEGRHEYKFLVDGQWKCDNEAKKTQNKCGAENNVMNIDKSQFEVLNTEENGGSVHSVDSDSAMESNNSLFALDPTADACYEWGQKVPDRKAFSACDKPPALPPHLLEIMLNKETPMTHDPNELQRPVNHVMLNHLCALSIKDGVMVLATSNRYRKRYCTTVFYKPI